MKKKYLILIGVIVVVAIFIIINLKAKKGKALEVQVEEVERRDLSMLISASGSIRPKKQVDISASSIGKVTRVAVKEGDVVTKGQFLIQIDPIQLESNVAQLNAALDAARANEQQALVQLNQYQKELDRAKKLILQGHITNRELDAAQTNFDVGVSNLETARYQIAMQKALLDSARHNLREVTITAGMEGVVTRLNVEEGEIAIMGTLNNPGTVLMTIADLSTIETEVEVDETEVVDIELGDKAKVTLDAFPDTSYVGEVTELGNSPILSSSASGAQGVDFKVVVTITDRILNVRPGLSADAEITAAECKDGLSIPIQSLTVRRQKDLKDYKKSADSTAVNDEEKGQDEIEGVFVVEDGRARFRPVEIGISSQKYFQVLSGLESGEKVVSGNFKAIRDLKDGQRVKEIKKAKKKD
ncbi:MAG: efflux RND transporter periplasmic adaptor subunit [Candidatus Krumholzibacteriota bacterium]|nr:efflux RND transporter periplasmic adaptor subunit [Candidatus Krumholzibacteriota bacterium]